MPADLSSITYFAPIAAFLIVFLISYAIFAKTKLLGESKWLNLFISFLIATVFISAAGATTYVQTVIPWAAILLITLVFILMITGLVGKSTEFMSKGIGVVFVIILGLVFLISAFFVFSHILAGYLPGPNFGYKADPQAIFYLSWLYSPIVLGAILLVIISAVVTWVLVKAK